MASGREEVDEGNGSSGPFPPDHSGGDLTAVPRGGRPGSRQRFRVRHELIDRDPGPLLPTRRPVRLEVGFIPMKRREDVPGSRPLGVSTT